ncbi:MAG: phage major capsid protein [Huintestinicola sp.]
MLKELIEQRSTKAKRMNDLITAIKTETRAFSEDEQAEFDQLEDEIRALDRTIQSAKDSASIISAEVGEPAENAGSKDGTTELRAARQQVNDMLHGIEQRAPYDGNSVSSTGGIVPIEYSNDIIRKTVQLSNILSRITIVKSKGVYKQIMEDDGTTNSAYWTGELEEVTKSKAKYKTIDIVHEKLASISVVSEEAVNQMEFDIVGDIEAKQIRDFAEKAEEAVYKGTGSGMPYGLSTSGTEFALASATAITADELIKIYHKLDASYMANAAWDMSNDTLCAVRMLKDGNGQYLFHQNEDLTKDYEGTLFGKPVYLSEMVDNMGSGKNPIFFGDVRAAYKGNLNPGISVKLLNEKYSEYVAVGIQSVMWFGGRPVNKKAYVKAVCPTIGG